ncbi:MAG: outer membrane beta-barrel protein [Bacteroidota bacterium]
MRKSCVFLTWLLLAGSCIQGQSIYLRGGSGAALSTSPDIIPDYTINIGSGNIEKVTSKEAGNGTGLPFAVAAGYKFNKFLGIELGVNYLAGFAVSNTIDYGTVSVETKKQCSMLSLVPAAVLTFPAGKVNPYARLGLKLGILNRVIFNDHVAPGSNHTEIITKSVDYGGIAVGVQAAAGAEYPLNKLVSVFGEIQVDGISYSPKHGKYTKYTEDGVDKMGSRTVNQNHWDFVKSLDNNKTIPADQPDEVAIQNFAFNNAGVVVGLLFRIR